jgi:RNA recognition motif-containing protein
VFLRGIPAATTEEELHGVFGKFGNIVKVAIIPSRTHDTNTAYVDYDTTEAVQAAMDAYGSDRGEGNEEKLVHRLNVRGKSVTVLLKLPRTQRPVPVAMGGRGGDFRSRGPGSYNRGGEWRWGLHEGSAHRQQTAPSTWFPGPSSASRGLYAGHV